MSPRLISELRAAGDISIFELLGRSTSTAYINPTAHSHSPTVNVADREGRAQRQLMDRGAPEYTQPGLHSPYSLALRDSQSERSSSPDQASAAQYTNTPQQDVRPANFASSSTPTSDYSVNASSARSANFPPDYLARQQQYAHHQNSASAGAGNMAQATSPSMSLQDGHQHNHHNAPHMKSDPDVPIDPSIAASSPTFPGHYSPYPPPGTTWHNIRVIRRRRCTVAPIGLRNTHSTRMVCLVLTVPLGPPSHLHPQ